MLDSNAKLVALDTHRIGFGFYLAVPADADLRGHVDALAAGRSPEHRRIGVAIVPSRVAARLRRSVGLPEREGLLVRAVEDGSPAANAGIVAGDLLVKAGGVELRTADDLFSVLDAAGENLVVEFVPRRRRAQRHGGVRSHVVAGPRWAAMEPASPDLPLRLYEPRPQVRLHETHVPRSCVPCIDAHNHLGRWLSRDWMTSDVGALIFVMDACNVATVVNLDGRWGDELEANLDRYDHAHPGRFLTFCHLDWSVLAGENPTPLDKQLDDAARRGARGLKVWKDLGLGVRDVRGNLVLPDDPRLSDVFAAAGVLGLPVLMHTADPVAFFAPVDRYNERLEELAAHPDWWFGGDSMPALSRLLDAFEAVVAAHPGTTFIGAHAGNCAEDLVWVARLLDTYPNLTIQIAARLGELGRQPRATRRLIVGRPIGFCSERIAFRPAPPTTRCTSAFSNPTMSILTMRPACGCRRTRALADLGHRPAPRCSRTGLRGQRAKALTHQRVRVTRSGSGKRSRWASTRSSHSDQIASIVSFEDTLGSSIAAAVAARIRCAIAARTTSSATLSVTRLSAADCGEVTNRLRPQAIAVDHTRNLHTGAIREIRYQFAFATLP